MELIIKSITAYHKDVNGCKKHKKDIMISFTIEEDKLVNMVHDLFLTKGQAENLLEYLKTSLAQNEEKED